MKKLGLYIHLPFCVQKCLYCDFCSFAGSDRELMRAYVSRLCRDIGEWSARCAEHSVDTVYFGGGTPTLLPISEFERLMGAINRYFKLDKDCEISSECNPATADREYLGALRKMGVNRLSIGLQSANENELRAIGRIHSYADFVDTYNSARSAGFDNISADLMYGIPEQSIKSFERTLDEVISLEPEHISAYGLKIEEGTPFGRMRDSLILPNEDSEYDMYMLCSECLEGAGYNKYEISNFAHKGYASRHNIKYWMGEEYLGFGVSAHSYFGECRFANSRDIDAYIRGADICSENRHISPPEKLTEYVMLRMRLTCGVDHGDFKARFDEDFEALYSKKLDGYVKQGFVISEQGRTFFSDKGFFVSNYILSDILDFE
ncbi:MAG: radical SAM family heme chaperone HemW [Ruminococcaceae bacterium]|nr:radical SAM family heme chaperone HemW [Oscillospiraceae bacterium]